MKSQKIINLLDHKDEDDPRFETKKWYIVNDNKNYFLPKIIINIIKLIVLYVKKTLRINIQKFLKQKMGD